MPVQRAVNIRPMFISAIGFGLGIFLGSLIREAPTVIIAFVMVFLIPVLAFMVRSKLYAAMLFALCVTIGLLRITAAYPPLPEPGVYSISGRIAETPVYDADGLLLTIDNVELNGNRVSGRLLVPVDASYSLKYGQIIEGGAHLYPLSDGQGYNGFDALHYYLCDGIIAKTSKPDPLSLEDGKNDIYGMCLSARETIKAAIDDIFGENAPLISGMLLGEKSGINHHYMNAFRNSGTAHLFAVSGLHVGLFVAFLSILIPKRKAWLRIFVIGSFLLLYCAVTAFPASLVRASIMSMCLLMASPLNRRYDLLSSISSAAVIVLMANPFMLFSVSFQLSFCAVTAIALIYKPIAKLLGKALHGYISAAISISFCGTIGTLPLSVHYFGRVPLLGVLANIIVVPLVPLVLVPSLILIVIYFIFPDAARALAMFPSFVLNVITNFLSAVSSIPWGSLIVPQFPSISFVFAFLSLFFISPYFLKPLRSKALYACASMIILILLCCTGAN